jgi:hypothetical protein
MRKKVTLCLLLLMAVIIAVIYVFYIFEHETVTIGRYTVLYQKNMCDLEPEAFPQDLESLKHLPGLIRIIWQEQIGPNMFQGYSYLPGRGVEKTYLFHKKE